MKKLTYTDPDGITHHIVANEDQMEIIVGELMDMYWDNKGGWRITYTITDV